MHGQLWRRSKWVRLPDFGPLKLGAVSRWFSVVNAVRQFSYCFPHFEGLGKRSRPYEVLVSQGREWCFVQVCNLRRWVLAAAGFVASADPVDDFVAVSVGDGC